MGRTKENILKDLESKYRFIEVEVNDTLRYHEFSREAEGETHKVILEDHRDDEMKDWMIFSYLECSRLDYYGDKIDEQYPLELGEVKLFLEYIRCCK